MFSQVLVAVFILIFLIGITHTKNFYMPNNFHSSNCSYAKPSKISELTKHYSEFVVHPIFMKKIETKEVEDEDAVEEEPEKKEGEDDDLEVEEEEEKPKTSRNGFNPSSPAKLLPSLRTNSNKKLEAKISSSSKEQHPNN